MTNTPEGNTGKDNTGNYNSGDRNSGDRNSGYRNSGYRNSGDRNSGYLNSGDRNSGDRNSGDRNSGDRNSGYRNSGDRNSGDRNSGNRNSGNRNSGDRNSGNRNSGDRNSGDRNSGNRNSGDRNSGNRNSGDRNSGDRNSGDRNSGDRNSGYLNSNKPTVRMFNKDTGIARDDFDVSFPGFFLFDFTPTEWISENDMTQEEKVANPLYNIAGGYLRKDIERATSHEKATAQMHEAWRKSWDEATDEDRRKVYTLPNWDNEIFKEISGIDVDKELNTKVEEMTVEQICKELGRNVKIVK